MEENDNIIVMTDVDGNEVNFELLDVMEYDDKEYLFLLPCDEEENDELAILEIIDIDEDNTTYQSVDDDELLMTLFEIFKEKFKDEYIFAD